MSKLLSHGKMFADDFAEGIEMKFGETEGCCDGDFGNWKGGKRF